MVNGLIGINGLLVQKIVMEEYEFVIEHAQVQNKVVMEILAMDYQNKLIFVILNNVILTV